jgi:hypothetical protein
MNKKETKPPNCWIRGDLEPSDLKGDRVRQATQNCQYRKATPSHSIFGGNDHVCTHPAAIDQYQEYQIIHNSLGSGVLVGGIDGFATFCEAVDMHLTSLGERSRLIIDGEFRDVPEKQKDGSLSVEYGGQGNSESQKDIDLTKKTQVMSYMSASKSEIDWNNRTNEVLAANGDNYPKFWSSVISESFIDEVSSKWQDRNT